MGFDCVKDQEKYYIAIDLKSYYASAECVSRGLDPLTTNLVVADATRTEKTICLAVSPSLKSYGVPGRPRLFEVVQAVKRINAKRLFDAKLAHKAIMKDGGLSLGDKSFDFTAIQRDPSLELDYIIAPPRMAYYVETSAKIYSIYLKYIAPEDICVYSIDEVFMDVTPYLTAYKMTAHELAMTIIQDVLNTTGITATAGIGTNLYLAKVAMDIVAKHSAPDADGVRIAELNELSFRELLWDHKPLTAFWMTGPATMRHLAQHHITTMGELARASLHDQEWFYKEFGVDAEILIDHAWGIETCTMQEIQAYRPSSTSISEGQVLSEPYSTADARVIVQEMAEGVVYQLLKRYMLAGGITMHISYDRENCENGAYHGATHLDHYGRTVPKSAHGTIKLEPATNLTTAIDTATLQLYDSIINKQLTVRRINITAIRVQRDSGYVEIDLFTDNKKALKEKCLQRAIMEIKHRFGKNSILRGTSYLDCATMRQRNGQIGGHRA